MSRRASRLDVETAFVAGQAVVLGAVLLAYGKASSPRVEARLRRLVRKHLNAAGLVARKKKTGAARG